MDLDAATREGVQDDLRAYLGTVPKEQLVGISCIADGADAIFAEVVLECGGRLHVILPSSDYRATKVKSTYLGRFDALLSRAVDVEIMHETANREAYEAANDRLLSACDVLVAVWDGIQSEKVGGTATTAAKARALGKPVVRIWREAYRRT